MLIQSAGCRTRPTARRRQGGLRRGARLARLARVVPPSPLHAGCHRRAGPWGKNGWMARRGAGKGRYGDQEPAAWGSLSASAAGRSSYARWRSCRSGVGEDVRVLAVVAQAEVGGVVRQPAGQVPPSPRARAPGSPGWRPIAGVQGGRRAGHAFGRGGAVKRGHDGPEATAISRAGASPLRAPSCSLPSPDGSASAARAATPTDGRATVAYRQGRRPDSAPSPAAGACATWRPSSASATRRSEW
jgi:hypothetical protein